MRGYLLAQVGGGVARMSARQWRILHRALAIHAEFMTLQNRPLSPDEQQRARALGAQFTTLCKLLRRSPDSLERLIGG